MKNLRGIYQGSLKTRRAIAREMKIESQRYGKEFIRLHKGNVRTFDLNGTPQDLLDCWRNKYYLVQYYQNGNWERLSINRTDYDPVRDCWLGDISWDDLMQIKDTLGFGNRDAIEIYPQTKDVIYVTYMRHLFLIPESLTNVIDCIWRKHNNGH